MVVNVGAEYLYLLIAIPQEFPIVNTCPLGAPLQQNFRRNSTENSAEIYGKKGAEKYLEVRISNSPLRVHMHTCGCQKGT